MRNKIRRFLSALLAAAPIISLSAGLSTAVLADDPPDPPPVTTTTVTFEILPLEALDAVLEVLNETLVPQTPVDIATPLVYELEDGEYTYTVTATGYEIYSDSFTVPGMDALIEITLIPETVTPPPAPTLYDIFLPVDDDGIWVIDTSALSAEPGKAEEGETVTVTVERAAGALLTELTGITATHSTDIDVPVTLAYSDVDANGAVKSGTYEFEMPAAEVTLSLDANYAELEIYIRQMNAAGGSSDTLKYSFTRAELMAGANADALYYCGYQSTTDGFIAKADKAIYLRDLFRMAGTSFETKDTLEVYTADGGKTDYTYAFLYPEVVPSYFPKMLDTSLTASEKRGGALNYHPFISIREHRITTTDYTSTHSDDLTGVVCDTERTYTLAYGFSGNVVENFARGDPAQGYTLNVPAPSNVNKIIIIKPYVDHRAGLDDWQDKDTEGFQTIVNKSKISPNSAQMAASPVWNGAIDVSWFTPDAYEYYISTPAQLAGLAALVNGLHNETTYYVGETDYIRVFKAVSDDPDGPNGQNMSTADYHMGKYDFNGKTVYLTADINMGGSANNYMPIGGQYLMKPYDSTTKLSSSFCGTFDGQGHTVSNIYCDRYAGSVNYGDGQSVGLIGRLGVHDNDPASWRPVQPTVRNVAVSGYIYANRSVGGIVGKIGKTSINNGDRSQGAIIENCANFATVKNTDSKGCGGIVGAGWNGGIIRNCYNAGDVSSTYNCPTAGISGSNEIIIYNCFSVGKVSTSSPQFGMAIGTNNGGGTQIDKCYWLQNSSTGGGYYGKFDGEVLEKTEEYMKSDEFVALLNANAKEKVFAADLTGSSQINKGFPIFTWQGGRTVKDSTDNKDTEEEQASIEATVEDGVATVKFTDEYIDGLLETLAAGNKNVLVITLDDTDEDYDTTVLELSAPSVKKLADGEITLTLDSDIAAMTFLADVLEQISKAAGENGVVQITVSRNGDGEYEFIITAGNKKITVINGGIVVSVHTETTDNTVSAIINGDDSETIIKKSSVGEKGIRMRLGGSQRIRVFDGGERFSDVPKDSWFESPIGFVSARGLMGKMADGFSPDDNMTRGMLVTVLHRLEDLPKRLGNVGFSDMSSGDWYFDAMGWAAENKLVLGITANEAAPEDDITREQIAVVFYRYAKHLGLAGTDSAADLEEFSDGGEVSDWAKDAFAWVVSCGLITGRDDTELAPGATATRAEVATMLRRIIEMLV